MILLLAKEIDLGRYLEVSNIVNRFRYRLEMVTHIDWPTTDLSTLKPGETLYISAHGSHNDVEDRTPDVLAKDLIGKGLKDGVSFKKIKLMSCGSGITSKISAPYCQRLAEELSKNGGPKNAVVVGFDGATTVCDSDGKIYAKNTPQSEYTNWSEFLAKHKKNFDHFNAVAKKMPCVNLEDFIKNSLTLMSQPEVKEAFDWLYAANDGYIIKDSKVGKTYANTGGNWKKK
jgi:hypothetical protein